MKEENRTQEMPGVVQGRRAMPDVQGFLPFLHELADVAGRTILPFFRQPLAVDSKAADRFDPVTEADRRAERAMRDLIAARFPDHGVVGEEYGPDRPEADHVWLLDPIDGTRAFVAGLPLWGVLIGLRREGVPVLGMIAQPYLGERFYGSAEGSFLERGGERRRLATRPCPALAAATLSTTAPDLFSADEETRYRSVEREARLVRYGYDCYAYAMVALGFVDCVVEAGLGAHDIEPIVPIVAGAGGFATDWSGRPKRGGGRVVVAGDRRVLDAALQRLGR